MAAVARRKFSANLEVCTPQEVQWKPPLRQAAGTLGDTEGTAVHTSNDYWNDKTKNQLITN